MLATKTVYSLYYPETRRIVDALWSEKPHHLYERNYTKRQDGMHQPFLDGWRRFARNAGVVFSEEFRSAYPIAGANEGLQALVASCAARPSSERPRLHLFAGEYEGFQYLASAAFLEVVVHSREPELYRASFAHEARRGDWLFVSQPSAIDGNVWLGFAELVRFLEAHVPEISLCVDLTYVGAVAKDYSIELASPIVKAVVASLSKPFGVYYHRIGALLSREPVASLYGNLWFKNLFSLALGEKLVATYGPRDLPARYTELQRVALERATSAGDVDSSAEPCDVVLLAGSRLAPGAEPEPRFRDFVRMRDESGSVLRFCLSPAMDAILAERSES